MSDITLPNIDDLEAQIEAATNNIRSFSVKIPKEGSRKSKFEFRVDVGDSSQKYNFDLDGHNFRIPILPDVFLDDSTLNESYSFKTDSISNAIRSLINDSMIFNQKEFHFQLKEFEKEMQKLREQMLKLQKNLQKEPANVKSEKSIEI